MVYVGDMVDDVVGVVVMLVVVTVGDKREVTVGTVVGTVVVVEGEVIVVESGVEAEAATMDAPVAAGATVVVTTLELVVNVVGKSSVLNLWRNDGVS